MTSPRRASRATSRDSVDTSMLVITDKIDLTLCAAVRQRRQHAPHRDGEVFRRQRMGGEIRHHRRADPVDQVGQKIFKVEFAGSGMTEPKIGIASDHKGIKVHLQ